MVVEVEVDTDEVRVEDIEMDHRLEVLEVGTVVDLLHLEDQAEAIAEAQVVEVGGAIEVDHHLEDQVVDTEVDLLHLRKEGTEVEVKGVQRVEVNEDTEVDHHLEDQVVDTEVDLLHLEDQAEAIAEVQVVEVAGVTEVHRQERILLEVDIADHHREATGHMIEIIRVVLLERMTVDDMLDRVRVNSTEEDPRDPLFFRLCRIISSLISRRIFLYSSYVEKIIYTKSEGIISEGP